MSKNEKLINLYTVVGFAVLLTTIFAVVLWPSNAKKISMECESKINNKWINGRCVDFKCKEKATCEEVTCTACECRNLVSGQSVDDVYALLGQPRRIEGDRLIWLAGKGESQEISVVIKNDHMHSSSCNP
jgi:hypothetical protein